MMVVAVVSESDVGSFLDMEQTRYPDGLHVSGRGRGGEDDPEF